MLLLSSSAPVTIHLIIHAGNQRWRGGKSTSHHLDRSRPAREVEVNVPPERGSLVPCLRTRGERVEPGRLDVVFDLTEIEIGTTYIRAYVRISTPLIVTYPNKRVREKRKLIGGDRTEGLTRARVACRWQHTPLTNSRASGPRHTRGTPVNIGARRFLPAAVHCSGSTVRGVRRAVCG